MPRTIKLSVEFQNLTPQVLYESYLDSKQHGALIGGDANVQPNVGGKFSAFGGGLQGRILDLVPGRQIVQTWRGQPWREQDLDSIVILQFVKTTNGARIDLVHANIPDEACALVNEDAWNSRYWVPWQKGLTNARSGAA